MNYNVMLIFVGSPSQAVLQATVNRGINDEDK